MTAPRPLEGVRVLDLCVVWAGTFATCLLADLGAEVIKLENVHVFQPMTRGAMARPPQQVMTGGTAWGSGYPNNEPGPRPWNYCPTFVQLFRNKRSVTIDLTSARGQQLLRPLIEQTDVFVENNAVGTAEKLHLDYDSLRAINPKIIVLRAPGYGLTGPYRDARTLGAHLESVTGHTLLRGYPDRDPSQTSAIFAGDHMAGAQGAFAIMAALRHRRRTGEGQLIEMSQAEGAAPMIAQAYMHQAFQGAPPDPTGNHSIYGFVPHNLYPCRSPGTPADGGDHWIAITVTSDDEWRALRSVMGDPDWAADAALDGNEGRRAREDEIDAEIAAWTQGQDDYDVFHRLQRAGVPAAPILEASRVFDDPHVQARELNSPQTLPDGVGPYLFNNPPYRFPATPLRTERPSVALGQDNEYVYTELIGLSKAEYQAVVDAGDAGLDFDADIP